MSAPDERAADNPGPTPPELDPIKRARTIFLEARDRFYEDAFGEAGELFLQSFTAYPSLEALYGAANSFERNGDILIALELYDRYFTYVDDHPTRPASAQRSYRALTRLVGRVDIEVAPGASFRTLKINGKPVAKAKLPARVLPGVVRVEFLGDETWQREQLDTEVLAGATAVFKFSGFRQPPKMPGPALPPGGNPDIKPDTPPRPRRSQVATNVFWAGLGMTAASGVALTTLGALTIRERNRFESELGMTPYPADHEANFQRYRQVTNVLIGVTSGLAAFTIVSGVIALSSRRRASQRNKVSLGPEGLHF